MSVSFGGGSRQPKFGQSSGAQMPIGCAIPFFGIFAGMGTLFLFLILGAIINGQMPGFAALFILLPLVFIAVGVGGIVSSVRNVGKSRESLNVVVGTERALPISPLAKTPGQSLAWRLPMEQGQKAATCVLSFFALFWNGIVLCGFVSILGGYVAGRESVVGLLFMLPFIAIGIVLLVLVARQFMIAYGVKETVVEIEREPVCPGERVRIRVVQSGAMEVDDYTVALVGEERITYRRGTDTYHDKHVIQATEVYRSGSMRFDASNPWEQSFEISIPADAMHSFHSPNNEVVWTINVKAKVRRWPDFEFKFPLRVVPTGTREMVEWP